MGFMSDIKYLIYILYLIIVHNTPQTAPSQIRFFYKLYERIMSVIIYADEM